MTTNSELVSAEMAVKKQLPTAYVTGKMSASNMMWHHVFTPGNPCEHGHGKTAKDAWRCAADRMGLKYKPSLTPKEFVLSLHPGAFVESDSHGVSIRVRDESRSVSNIKYYGHASSDEQLAWHKLARELGWQPDAEG